MSGGKACECSEREEHLHMSKTGNRPRRLWRVAQRNCNHSAFNGHRYTPSAWSAVFCLRCGAHWRTKASYVADIPDMLPGDLNIAPGVSGYRETMIAYGREPL